MTRLYIFADDSMMGREAGTEGNVKGNAYIEGELQPARTAAGRRQRELLQQAVPFVRRGFDRNATIAAGDQTLQFGTDFLPAPGGTPRSIDGAAVVFGGAIGADGTTGITAEQANGKVVVVTAASAAVVRNLRNLGPLQGAAGVALVLLDELPANFRASFTRVQTTVDSAAFAAAGSGTTPAATDPMTLIVSRRAAEAMLGTPVASATPGMAGRTIKGTIPFRVERAPGTNVVAILPGSDAKLRGSVRRVGRAQRSRRHLAARGRPRLAEGVQRRGAARRRWRSTPRATRSCRPTRTRGCSRSRRRSA